MLDEESTKTFMGPQWCTVNDHRCTFHGFLVTVGQPKTLRHHQIELVRRCRFFTSNHVAHLKINFRTIKGCFATNRLIRDADFVHGFDDKCLGTGPDFRFVDVFGPVGFCKGKPHPEIFQPE